MTVVVTASSVRWVDPIAERVQWLVDHRAEGNARALARKAGLPSETHVGLILERGAARTAGTVLAKIAEAGGVRLDWLIKGEEPRDVVASPERTVVYDARYPNLEKALGPLIAELRPKTPARIRSTTFASNRDLTVIEWTRHILAEDERVRWEEEHGAPEGSITKEILEQGAKDRPDLPPPPAKWPGGRRPKPAR